VVKSVLKQTYREMKKMAERGGRKREEEDGNNGF